MLYYCRNLLLLSAIAVVGCKFATASGTVINSDNTTSTDDPQEIQKAVCTVTAGEVRASAEAVTTKTLQGVCGSAEMHIALRNLELKIFKELQEVKQLLMEIHQPNYRGKPIRIFSLNDNQPEMTTSSTTTTAPAITSEAFSTTDPSSTPDSLQMKRKLPPQLKSLPSRTIPFKEKSFSYYWKLENFTEHINGSRGRVESPVFSIKGKLLRITASFKHLQRDFLFLHLVYATFEKRDRTNNNIVLDTGGLFKHIEDKVAFKHTISILDQDNGSKNLVSQEFTSLDSGFTVPMSALLLPTYSKNNSLLIQISLYL